MANTITGSTLDICCNVWKMGKKWFSFSIVAGLIGFYCCICIGAWFMIASGRKKDWNWMLIDVKWLPLINHVTGVKCKEKRSIDNFLTTINDGAKGWLIIQF